MIGKFVFLATVAAVCDAALIPVSSSWPCQTTASRTSSSGLGFVPNSGGLDYNQLLHVLYSEVTQDPFDGLSSGLFSGYSQAGTGYEMSDLYKTTIPGMRGSSGLIMPSRELGYGQYRVSGRSSGYDDYRNKVLRNYGECRGYDDCRNCGEMRRNCDCREFEEERDNCECRGCGDERSMNDCRGCCRNCGQQRSNSECRECSSQRNMDCRNCCDSIDCYSHCGCMGCSRPISSSRSGYNYNRCGSSGCSSQRNMQCSPCRCKKVQGQSRWSSMCC